MIIKPLMLAKTYADQNVTGWLMSEKLDGVWARYQDGKFYSRLGNQFVTPKDFCKELPKDIQLDGELWGGRNSFQYVTGIVRKNTPVESEWFAIDFAIHDCPSPLPFSKRYELLKNVVGEARHFFVVGQQDVCNMEYAKKFYTAAIALGGEGAMFKDPKAPYVHGRVGTFLKWKPSHTDEAEVIGYMPGEGKYLGCVGSLECKWKDKLILLGSGLSDVHRQCPPKKGSKVTFKYDSLTNEGMPRFPRFISVRNYE